MRSFSKAELNLPSALLHLICFTLDCVISSFLCHLRYCFIVETCLVLDSNARCLYSPSRHARSSSGKYQWPAWVSHRRQSLGEVVSRDPRFWDGGSWGLHEILLIISYNQCSL